MAPTLAYWNVRGVGEQCRLLMHYLGIEFDDKRYNLGPAPDNDRSEWLAEKRLLGLDFPNLPYYVDGDVKLTQSSAIMEYIAEVNGMLPECLTQRAKLHMMQSEAMDCRIYFSHIYYYPIPEVTKELYKERMFDKLKSFEKYLNDRQWLTGDKINYPDFTLGELLHQLVEREPSCLVQYPNLQAYLSRFQDLPQLKKYMTAVNK